MGVASSPSLLLLLTQKKKHLNIGQKKMESRGILLIFVETKGQKIIFLDNFQRFPKKKRFVFYFFSCHDDHEDELNERNMN